MGRRRIFIGILCLSILLFGVFLFFFPYKQVVAFTYEDQGQLIAYLPIKDKSFQIKYTHSIHLSDVIESYDVTEGEIMLTQLSYKDFAVGMPSNAEGDEVFEEKNGTYYIKNMTRSFSYIDMRIGQVRANHRLIYQKITYQLAHYIEPGTWVRITPKKLTLWQQLKGVNINGG